MQESAYWSESIQRRIGRRRLIRIAGTSLAAAPFLACRGRGPAQAGSTGASQGSAGPVQPGGTFVWFRNKNDILDPQRVSSSDQQSVAGVYSRVFAFTTGPNPETAADHNIEGDI